MMDSKKANKVLGWRNKITLEKGLKTTIDWHVQNFKKLNKLSATYIHKK